MSKKKITRYKKRERLYEIDFKKRKARTIYKENGKVLRSEKLTSWPPDCPMITIREPIGDDARWPWEV